MWKENPDKTSLAERMVKILFVVTGILVLAALGLMGAAAWMQHASGSLGRLQAQMQEVKETSDETEQLIAVTQTILNSSTQDVTSTINSSKLEEIDALSSKIEDELQNEKQQLVNTLNDVGTPVDREAGNNALLLVNKQLLIVGRYENANAYAKPYISLNEEINSALAKLIEADSADRDASAQLMAGNSDDAGKSVESANKAKALALEAKAMFEQAEKVSKEAAVQLIDAQIFEEYVTYCQLIADAQDAAVACANAYVSRNKDELATQNEVYNKAKERANEISAAWKMEITDLLDNAFIEARAGDVDGFNQDLKERDSLFNSVSNYLKGKE